MKYKKVLTMLIVVAFAASLLAPLAAVNAQTSSKSLFSMTIIAPGNANLLRRQWAQVFASNLQQLGIDAKVVYLGWTPVNARVMYPDPEFVGKTYDQGGYDVLALGWTSGLGTEPRQNFYGGDAAFFAPSGQNYYLWNNTQANALLDTFITSTDNTEKQNVLTQWQQLYFSEVPASQIVYQQAPVVVSPHIKNLYTPVTGGEGWLYFNAQPYPQLLKRDDGKTQIVYCSTGEIDALNPPEANGWYDTIVDTPIFDGLAEAWPTLNGLSQLEVPALLTSWAPSNNGFTWTFNCRQGVTWHDGEQFTADDVVFSLWALMNVDTGTQFGGYYQGVYGDNTRFTYSNGTSVNLGNGTRIGNITATDKYTVVANLPVLAGGKPYGYFEPYLLSFANNIIPKHIFEYLDPATWKDTCFNTGQGTTTVNGKTYYGPVGTGPYMWIQSGEGSFDVTGQVVHLVRNDNYWNATALKNDGLFQTKDYYVRYIADKTAALAALKNGEVDMLDYNYQMQTDIPSIDSAWGKVIVLDGVGRQEFGYNMRHPIFGTGVDTPLGKSDPSRAAEAARDIREAFDFAIPRTQIINGLLGGYGLPGATAMLPTQPFYDSAITSRPYDLDQARQLLAAAGYTVPGASIVVNLGGTETFANGTAKATQSFLLMETLDNTTYQTSLTQITQITTDSTGKWSFNVYPTTVGTHYYYLVDNSTGTPDYKYLQSYTVSTATASPTVSPTGAPTATATPAPAATDYTLVYVAVAVVVIIVIIVAVALLMRRKPKQAPS